MKLIVAILHFWSEFIDKHLYKHISCGQVNNKIYPLLVGVHYSFSYISTNKKYYLYYLHYNSDQIQNIYKIDSFLCSFAWFSKIALKLGTN